MAEAPTTDDVQEALENVIDPELGLDFVELGLECGCPSAEGVARTARRTA